MKNYNDRIWGVPTSLRTNSLHAAFYKRQMKIITKRFTMGLSGLPVLLNNFKYYSKYTKLQSPLRKTNGKKLHMYLISVQPPQS